MILLASGNYIYPYFDKEKKQEYFIWTEEQRKIYNDVLAKGEKDYTIVEFIESPDRSYYTRKSKNGDRTVRSITIPLGRKFSTCGKVLLNNIKNATCFVVHGGNTFDISYLIHFNGWYDFIKEMVLENGINYIGYSAGAIMATPIVLTAQWADKMTDEFLACEEYSKGFGFVPFCVKPHSDSYLPNYYQYFKAFSIASGLDMECIYEEGTILFDEKKKEIVNKTFSFLIHPFE